MESYPGEFTAHLQPLMFVSGLESEMGEFTQLAEDLRIATGQKRTFPIWDNSRGASQEFHIAFVDKNIKFPPLKARPTSHNYGGPLHSPISPLTPSSPLYPDGIIAPIWIRKHRELVPAVFVLVLTLSESTSEQDKETFERNLDLQIIQQIIERKKSTTERGIKLAVILMCSRNLLDSQSIDPRLSFIRRQGGLDSRSSLFVLSPVDKQEVVNFFKTFKMELWAGVLDYYREHARRVRRKRARQVPKSKLPEKGWAVRYDYKMGVFSEIRGELEVALKHYEDSYDGLLEMFNILTVRTKRWAEAKVLIDSLNFKICKFYLYMFNHAKAPSKFQKHIATFRGLCNSWGIGEDTFEYWSWLSKQYKLFGELVSIAIRMGFRLPSLTPPPIPDSIQGPKQPSPELVPLFVLQHPGFYFYQSALCAIKRRDCFLIQSSIPLEEGETHSIAMNHEKEIKHSEMITDLFTKSYEYFKVHKNSRMSLMLASMIARTHFEAENYDMVIKFNDRIAKGYRKDHWIDILKSIDQTWFDSARILNRPLDVFGPAFALLARGSRSDVSDAVLQLLDPPKGGTQEVNIDLTETVAGLTFQPVFRQHKASLGELVSYEVIICSPPGAYMDPFTFQSMHINFNDSSDEVVVVHDAKLDPNATSISERAAFLNWKSGTQKGFTFQKETIKPAPQGLTISSVKFVLVIGDWTIFLTIPQNRFLVPENWRALKSETSTTCLVQQREAEAELSINFPGPAYLDEEFPIEVTITNNDSVNLSLVMSISLQPLDNAHDSIIINEIAAQNSVKDIPIGELAPHQSIVKSFKVLSQGIPRDRFLEVLIICTPVYSDSLYPPSTRTLSKKLTIPIVPPLFITVDTFFHERRRPIQGLMDFTEPDGWEGASLVGVTSRLVARGPWDIEVTNLRLSCDQAPGVRVVNQSTPDAVAFVWKPRDSFMAIHELEVISALPDQNDATPIKGTVLEVYWRRAGSVEQPQRSIAVLPPLHRVPLDVLVTLQIPAHMKLHQIAHLTLMLSNPTDKLLTLSLQIESSDAFVYAGVRKEYVMLGPSEERKMLLSLVPLYTGQCSLPRVRVFEKELVSNESETTKTTAIAKELRVVREYDIKEMKDARQLSLEKDLMVARGGDLAGDKDASTPFTIIVYPK